MSVVETINDSSHFYHWLQQSGSYKDNFSYEGANAVQAYFEELSDSMGEDVEFDPVAWCVEFSEYVDLAEAWTELGDEEVATESILEWLQDRATVLELDNGHIVVGEF